MYPPDYAGNNLERGLVRRHGSAVSIAEWLTEKPLLAGHHPQVSVAATVTAETLHPFADNQWHHDHSGHGISPPPAQQRIQQQAGEEDSGKIGAKVGLAGIGVHGAAVKLAGDLALGPGQQRHGDERGRRHSDSEQTFLRSLTKNETLDGIERDVSGQGKEADAN